MISETKGEEYRPVMRFVVIACYGRLSKRAMHKWFLCSKEGLRRSRLRGWQLWYEFCLKHNLSVNDLISNEYPEHLVSEFLAELDAKPKNK